VGSVATTAITASLVLLAACTDDGRPPFIESGCMEGERRDCECDGGEEGTQRCLTTGWTDCECEGSSVNAGGAANPNTAGAAGAANPSIGGAGGAANPGTGGAAGAGNPGTGGTGAVPPVLGEECLTSSVLDPDAVYVWGNIFASIGSPGITAVGCPQVAVIGFEREGGIDSPQITPDGRLLYSDTFDGWVRHFNCDNECAVTNVTDFTYPTPSEALANDPVIYSCDSEWLDYKLSPDGMTLLKCGTGLPEYWEEVGGNRTFETDDADERLAHLGYDGLAMTLQSVVDLNTGELHRLDGLEKRGFGRLYRATPNGFLVADMPTGAIPEQWSLWDVDAAGRATKLGDYPVPPAEYQGDRRVRWLQRDSFSGGAMGRMASWC